MSQIFHRSTNTLSRATIFGAIFVVAALVWVGYAIQGSPYVTYEGVRKPQPVPFSHQHHVTGLGIDCRYCHTSVENSSFAGIPPTKTCMNCHSEIWTNANLLEPVRYSYRENRPIWWTRIHDLPDYVYFNHKIHVNKGVGCASCHGPVDEMPLMYQHSSLQMEWCLDCHRNPAKFLRPRGDLVFNIGWRGPSKESPVYCENGTGNCAIGTSKEAPPLPTSGKPMQHPVQFMDQMALGKYLTDQYHIRNPYALTSCETCHR